VLGLLAVPGLYVDALAFLVIFAPFSLLVFWELLEPIVDRVLQRGGEAAREPTDWLHTGDWHEWVAAYVVLIPTAFLNPLVFVQDLFQFVGSAVGYTRHRGSVPDAGDELEGSYRLPLAGTWTVVNGSLTEAYSHSWFPLAQRYAYDFVITDDDGHRRPAGAPTALEEYYCYDEPVLAPADGVVVDVFDSDFEFPRGGGLAHPLKRDIRGNYVTIQHAPGEYSTLAHLVPGSVAVEPGDRVARGQQVGRCGHSGNSSEPHLHFQLQDSPAFETAAGLPVRFDGVETDHPEREAVGDDGRLPGLPADDGTAPDGGPTAITAGQRVTADGGSSPDGGRDPDDSTDVDAGGQVPLRGVTALLGRTGFGASVGALLAGVTGLVLAASTVTLVLAGSVVAGVAVWVAGRLAGFVPRPGGPGLVLGIGLVALAWSAGLLTGVSLSLLFVAGFLWYATVAELDRLRLARAFDAPAR